MELISSGLRKVIVLWSTNNSMFMMHGWRIRRLQIMSSVSELRWVNIGNPTQGLVLHTGAPSPFSLIMYVLTPDGEFFWIGGLNLLYYEELSKQA